jgi:1,4-dihydroxy-2-naphthoate polyprenyltransferase
MNNWIVASRVRTLPAAIAPVILGCAICQKPHLLAAISALIGAVLIQIGTNFANDYFDFIKGTDNEDRVGPTRATQGGLITPAHMKRAFLLTFAFTIPIIAYLTLRAGWPIILIGILSIASGILYTGGPKPLGYIGLGDIFVLVFFGPVAVAGTDFVQSLEWSIDSIVIGLASGLISTAILVVNNLRDIDSDRTAGKNTLAVQFGPTFARIEYTLCIIGASVISIIYSFDRQWVSLSGIALLMSVPIIKSMWRDSGKDLDPNLAKTAKVLVLYSVLFSVGWKLG